MSAQSRAVTRKAGLHHDAYHMQLLLDLSNTLFIPGKLNVEYDILLDAILQQPYGISGSYIRSQSSPFIFARLTILTKVTSISRRLRLRQKLDWKRC